MTAPAWHRDFTEVNVCLGENLTYDDAGNLILQPWAVPRLVADGVFRSGSDGNLLPDISLPGKLLISGRLRWRSDAPIPQDIQITVTRAWRSLITCNPNAVQFRDRWAYAIDADPVEPVTTSIFNGQVGSAIDFGTNSVAEPNPGKQWMWFPANTMTQWVHNVPPGSAINLWYQCYVWTPPPWSDNANKNEPEHKASAQWARLSMMSYPRQGTMSTVVYT